MFAIAFAVAGGASLTEAGKVRSTVERHQHPGSGFWDDDHKSQNVVPHRAAPRVYYSPKSTKTKSWGRQLHHCFDLATESIVSYRTRWRRVQILEQTGQLQKERSSLLLVLKCVVAIDHRLAQPEHFHLSLQGH